jgi:hypothetical protein
MAIGAAPANGLQIVLPVVPNIPPSSSQEWCTWTDQTADHDLDVNEVKAFQTKTGHHVVLFYTTVKQTPGTSRICTDDDMASFRFVSASGGEGSGDSKLPGDLIARVPKGAQFVINHHYLNAGLTAVDAQSAANVYFAPPGSSTTLSSALTWLDTSMRAAPGHSKYDVHCTMKNDVSLWLLQPHMHAYGEHIIIEHTHQGTVNRLFDLDWDESFVFHPPEMRKDPSSPYVINAGDEIHLQCAWNNTTNSDLTFGIEMCVAFAQDVDKTGLGNIECDGGNWGTF